MTALSSQDDQQALMGSATTKPVDREWLLKLLRKHNHATPPGFPPSDKALVVAPMVDASDLPFRLLCRRYGLNLAFTPMIHAKLFCERDRYRTAFFDLNKGTPPEDRPLIAQFCGSNLDYIQRAATVIAPHVDAIDINCGCPQGIAKRGRYGAFLLEQGDDLVELVQNLRACLNVPVCVKARLLPSGVEDSLALYTKLVDAGASMITIHGRNRFQKGTDTGRADWNAIQQAVQLLGDKIPILANGSVSNHQEAMDCLQHTGADGVMVSEALLEYPAMFYSSNRVPRLEIAKQYMELARQYPPQEGGQGSGVKCVRGHLHRFLHADLQQHTSIRDALVHGKSMEDFEMALQQLEQIHKETNHDASKEILSWYMRHRNITAPAVKPKTQAAPPSLPPPLMEDAATCMANLFQDDEW